MNIDGSTTPGELSPLLTPHDEHFLAKIINKPPDQEIVFSDGKQRPQAPEASIEPPLNIAEHNASTAVKEGGVSDSDWKDGLKAKWGYLENFGSASRTRLEQIGKRKDKGTGKGKALKETADISEVSQALHPKKIANCDLALQCRFYWNEYTGDLDAHRAA